MPRVPTYDNFQATPNALPQVRINAPEVQDVSGRQAQQLGQNMTQAAGAVGNIALDMQQQADQLRLTEAMDKAKNAALDLTYDKDSGFQNLKGINALERPGKKSLADEYGENLKSRLDTIASTLGNDNQRRAFALQAGGVLASFRGQLVQHEAQEFKNYSLSLAEGVQATALREIGLRWNQPEAVDAAVQRIRAEGYRQGQLLGKSAEWQEASVRKLTSNAHKTALLAALEQNNPTYADSYLNRYADQMDADDILAVRGHITKAMDANVGRAVAGQTIQQMQTRIAPNEIDRLTNIVVGMESSGRRYGTDGKLLESPKGAKGEMQVLDGTNKDPGFGVKPARDDSPDERARVGRDYLAAMLQRYKGSAALAMAAYNAGPGAVDSAIAKADKSAALNKNDPSVQRIEWLGFLPKETRDYVNKGMRELEVGGGQGQRPTFQEIDAALRQRPELADNPARYKIAREEASRLYDDLNKAIKQRDEEAVANAMRGIIQNGGRFSDLPVTIRAAVPPGEVDNLIGFAQKIAKGDDSSSPWLYNKLTSNPSYLAGTSDNEFFALRKELSEADFKHFSQERAKLRGGAPGANGPGDLNTQAIKQTLDERLRMLKIDPTPKDDGGSDAARVGGIRKFVNDYFVSAQREAGKKFTDTEVAQHVDALFAKNATFRGLFSNSTGPMLGMKAGDIPSAEKDAIKAAFKRQGNDSPTDAQILDIYWKSQIARK